MNRFRMLLGPILLTAVAGAPGCVAGGRVEPAGAPTDGLQASREAPSTFSIAAFDPENGDLGVAVASRFLAVGSVVPWVQEGVGAVATQSYANTSYGPRGLILLRDGWTPEEAVGLLVGTDPEREFRQVGLVDARGRSFGFTGDRCLPFASSRTSTGYAIQGNVLVSEKTLRAMEAAYIEAPGELSERLLAALDAGEAAGGDSRGRQSAALLVARKKAGYGGFNGRYIDLRVDDHPRPVRELRRLLLLALGKDPRGEARKLESRGRLDDALRVLETALRKEPGSQDLRFEIARLLLKEGKLVGGREELQMAIAADAFSPHDHLRAARILAEAGLLDDCLRELRETVAINPEFREALSRELESPVTPLRRYREEIEAALRRDDGDPAEGPRSPRTREARGAPESR